MFRCDAQYIRKHPIFSAEKIIFGDRHGDSIACRPQWKIRVPWQKVYSREYDRDIQWA